MQARGTVFHGVVAGLGAALASTVLLLFLRIATGVPSIPELMGEFLTNFVPLPLFELMLGIFGSAAKRLLFVGVVVGQVGLGGLLAAAFYSLRASYRDVSLVLAFIWLVTVLGVFPLVGYGYFGAKLAYGPVVASGSTIVLLGVYGVLQGILRSSVARLFAPPSPEVDLARRNLLVRGGAGLFTVAVVGTALAQALASLGKTSAKASGVEPVGAARPPRAPDRISEEALAKLTPEITANDQFYVVSKNLFADPVVDASRWRLEFGGNVEKPFTLTYEELKSLPAIEQYMTLECISNEIGGDLTGNALWKGVRLRDLLQQAGVRENTRKIMFTCADDYTDSIFPEKAMASGCLVAYEMNGAPLSPGHGFPARVLVPGIYGMKNVKWVTSIMALDHDFLGFWQRRGWDDLAEYRTHTRIDVPRNRALLGAGSADIGGIAFAGDRGIARVEVSADDGATWQEAYLKDALSPYTWVLWLYDWTPPRSGQYAIKVRATDKKGQVQTGAIEPPSPAGASGYHAIVVRVAQA